MFRSLGALAWTSTALGTPAILAAAAVAPLRHISSGRSSSGGSNSSGSSGSNSSGSNSSGSSGGSSSSPLEPIDAGDATADGDMGFIQKAKLAGVNSLLGLFTHLPGRFDSAFKDLHVDAFGDGSVTCTLPVSPAVQNSYGTLHGGAICTLVDIVGTLALLSKDATRGGVSVEISTSFASAAKLGDEVTIHGRVFKYGRRLGFTQVDLINPTTNAVIATGRHTKAL